VQQPPPPRPTGPIVINPKGKAPSWKLRDGRFVSSAAVADALKAKRRMVLIVSRPPSDWLAVRIPGSKISVAGAEIFVLLLLLLHGPAAAALAAACEATTTSARTSKRLTSRLGSPAMAALAMYACGSAFTATLLLLRGHRLQGIGTMFESDATVVLAEVVDPSTIDSLHRASRSGDPAQRALAAKKARDAVAARLEQLRQKRAQIEARARQLRK
jgi:hypothetical protein